MLYRGGLWTGVRESLGGFAWFGAYEAACRFMRDWNEERLRARKETGPLDPSAVKLSAGQFMMAGGMAGMAYHCFSFPADVIKSNYQTLPMQRHSVPSVWTMASKIHRQQGWSGFYRGFGVTLIRAIPSNAIIFLTYESLHKAFE
jgi:ornithine carrier protein